MRKNLVAVFFLLFLAPTVLFSADRDPVAVAIDTGGGSHLLIPEAYGMLDFSFPLGFSGFRLSAKAGFSYIFDLWQDIHAGNIYFPAGVELMYAPMNLGLEALYYSSLAAFTAEGIFEVSARTYLDLVTRPHFHMKLLFSLGLSVFWEFGTQPVFPVTAKLALRFAVPFKPESTKDPDDLIPEPTY